MTKSQPEIEFAHVFDVSPEVKTVRAFGYEIPQEFQVRYFIKSDKPLSKVCWSIGLEVEIAENGTPQTKSIDFQGDLWRFWRRDRRGRDTYWPVEKFPERQKLNYRSVDFEKVRTITSSVRTMNHLQSLAVAVALHSFDHVDGVWKKKVNFPDLNSKELKAAEREFIQRKSRVPRNPIDYQLVVELYYEAKNVGASAREYISVRYNESEELGDVPLDTVNNWIRTCRDMKILPESNYGKSKNSSPKKSAGNKSSAKKGK